MSKRVCYLAIALIAALGLVSCNPSSEAQQEPQLEFKTSIEIKADQECHINLGVQNAGDSAFEGDERFNGQMEIRRVPSDELRASAEVIPLQPLAPDETIWPMDWHSRLEPGTYRLTWGAEGYGSTIRQFTINEKDGRLYIGEEQRNNLTPEEPNPEKAVSDLAERLGISAEAITVRSIEPTEFPDASLGVPEPGKSYAQVITPGYIIQLEANGEVYEYHAAGDRVVFVPQETEGSTSSAPAYQQVTIPEMGLSFEVPADWQQLEPEMAWTPDESGERRLALNGVEIEPPMEPEATMLPNPAQIVESQPVDLGWAKGRRFTLEVYASAAQGDGKAPVESVQTHVLVTLDQGEKRLGLDFYAVAPSAEALKELEPALQRMLDTATWVEEPQTQTIPGDNPETADWQVFEDTTHGFRFKYPQGWAYKELNAQGSGVPDDWPIERVVIFFPQAWAERFEQTGPPDPDAPPAVPAISLEVCVGPKEQFQRVYMEPTEREELSINGVTASREVEAVSDEIELIRYIFPSADEALHVVMNDALSGFPDRVVGNEDIVATIPLVAGTFEFIE
jgi:hypothetical protein